MEQVHCQNWPDLQAPKDTSVLLDMYEMVQVGPGWILTNFHLNNIFLAQKLAELEPGPDWGKDADVILEQSLILNN